MGVSAGVDATLAALAEPNRRRAIDLLSAGPRAAGELARELGLTPPAMSRHLRALKASGLVEETHPEFDARVRIYALRREPIAQLTAWLAEAEALWIDQLASLRTEAG